MSRSRPEDRRRSGFFRFMREGDFLFGLGWREKVMRPGEKPLIQIHFYWKRIFLLMLVLGVAGWLMAAGALYFYFKERRGYEEISYFKTLVLPFRLDAHRQEMGEFFIEKGMEEIEAGDFRAGFHHLRIGLARSPANAKARLLLAKIFHSPGFGDNRLAIQALREGLKFSDQDPGVFEPDYLGTLFFLLSEEEQDEERIELAEQLLDQVSDPRVRSLLILQAAHAESEIGLYRPAISRLLENQLQYSPQGYMLIGNTLWRAGYLRRAILTFERGMENFPDDRHLPNSMFSLLEKEELWGELLSHANFRRLMQPDFTKAWTARLSAWEGMGRSDEVIPAAAVILKQFPNSEAGFEILRIAVDHQRTDLAEFVMTRMREAGTFAEPHAALYALALLRGNQPQAALDFLEEIDEEGMPMEENRGAGLRSMAHLMLGNEEDSIVQFRRFLESDSLPASAYATIGEFYADAGFTDEAYLILQEGLERYPTDASILERILLDFEKGSTTGGAFVQHAQQMVDGRVPPVEVLLELREELVSDRYLFFPEQGDLVSRIDSVLDEAELLENSAAVTTSLGSSLSLEEPLSDRELMKIQ